MIRIVALLVPALLTLSCGGEGSEREIIATPDAPAAIGPYSQAVHSGQTLYLAGQLGLDPATGQLVLGGIEPETRQAMVNIQAVLRAAGYTFDDVVQVQAYLADMNEYGDFNTIYAGFFDGHPPARAVIEAARLPRDARVEVMATAVK